MGTPAYTITNLNETIDMTYHQAISIYAAMLRSEGFKALAEFHSLPTAPMTIHTPPSDHEADRIAKFLNEMVRAIGLPS
jgi:hypothetical protein